VKGQPRIETVFAFIVVDTDGTEGVPAQFYPAGVLGPAATWLPYVTADPTAVAAMRARVLADPNLTGTRVTLAQFTGRTNVETLQP
jgi:hypothetical protein